jgi:WD40 repeat protein
LTALLLLTLLLPAIGEPSQPAFTPDLKVGNDLNSAPLPFGALARMRHAESVHSEHSVRLWETSTGKELLSLEGHRSYVYSVAFSPDGKTLASGSADASILIWDLGTLLKGRQ